MSQFEKKVQKVVRASILSLVIQIVTRVLLIGSWKGLSFLCEEEVTFVPSVESVGTELKKVFFEVIGLSRDYWCFSLGTVLVERSCSSTFGETWMGSEFFIFRSCQVIIDDRHRWRLHYILVSVFVEPENFVIDSEKVYKFKFLPNSICSEFYFWFEFA